MLKNEQLIVKMSLEQKIQFITSTTLYSNDSVGTYEFPVFNISNHPLRARSRAYATFFPSDKALASTWIPHFVREVYKHKTTEAKAVLDTSFFNVSNDITKENVSADYYLSGRLASEKIKGINAAGGIVNYEKCATSEDINTQKELIDLMTELSLTKVALRSALFNDVKQLDAHEEVFANNDLKFAKATTKEQVVDYIKSGCSLIFLSEVSHDDVIRFVAEGVDRYNEAYNDLLENRISKEDFAKVCKEEYVVDEETLDAAVDNLMQVLVDLTNLKNEIKEEAKTINPHVHTSLFNEKTHDASALKIARQSVILLKNERVLPFKHTDRVAVLGEYAKDSAYQVAISDNLPTIVKLPFEAINDFDIKTVGFAYGYKREKPEDDEPAQIAVKLCQEADYALVYLCALKGEKTLPAEQLKLIDKLAEAKVKIVAVVAADCAIDMTFAKKCSAILYTYYNGQQGDIATLEVLSGSISPSGKLPENLYAGKEVKFAFGHGLSYAQFTYTNIKVSDQSVTCSVTNTSEVDGHATVQLYVSKEKTESTLINPSLRGFSKVYVRKGETVRVEIPLDDKTFRTYNEKTEHYVIEGGKYNIYLADSIDDVRLKGTISLSKHVYNDKGYEDELKIISSDVENAAQEFIKSEDRKEYFNEKRGIRFGVKLTFAILVGAYFNLMILIFAIANLIGDESLVVYGVLLILSILINLFVIIFIVKSAKKAIKYKYVNANDSLTALMDKVKNFDEVSKITYVDPVAVEEEVVLTEEEVIEEDTPVEEVQVQEVSIDDLHVAEVEDEEEIARVFGVDVENYEEEDTLVVQKVSLPEMCTNFRDFAFSKGVSIEIPSVRSIFAAIATAKIVFLNSTNTELLPKLLEIINEYFASTGVSQASTEWSSPKDLLWKNDGEKLVVSEFTKAVHQASVEKKKNCVAILNNVSMENLNSYFGQFIQFAIYPTEEHNVAINETLSIKLPTNICYILVPSEYDYLEKISRDVAKASVSIDVVIIEPEEEHEEVAIKPVNVLDFKELVNEAKEKFYLEEKIWKKIDLFIETIKLSEKFTIGNKNTLQLERFTSVFMECGGDEADAFNAGFSAKYVPILKTLKLYKNENGDRTILSYIEKEFSDEDISKISKTLLKKDQ